MHLLYWPGGVFPFASVKKISCLFNPPPMFLRYLLPQHSSGEFPPTLSQLSGDYSMWRTGKQWAKARTGRLGLAVVILLARHTSGPECRAHGGTSPDGCTPQKPWIPGQARNDERGRYVGCGAFKIGVGCWRAKE